MPSVRPPLDASSSAAPRDRSLLPVRSPGSAPRSSGSADPAASVDPPVVFLRPARLRTPLLGYGAPHLSARGTSTLLNNALLSARFRIADDQELGRSPNTSAQTAE